MNQGRAKRGKITEALEILGRAGVGNPPVAGDEILNPTRIKGPSPVKRERAGTGDTIDDPGAPQ